MVLFPRSGFARLLLAVIVIATISYLVLNLVSFAGTSWITYRDAPIRFGLWRVCDTSASGLCNQWADDTFSSNITLFIFGSSKPGFIRSSQALEIISLIFYVLAAVFIILGIINLRALPFHISFAIAAILLFICIVFLSATLGLMSVQGRSGRVAAELDWAWWNGLVGLIMTIVCFFSLIFFVVDMQLSPVNKAALGSRSTRRQRPAQNLWSGVPPAQYGSYMAPPPVVALNQMVYPPPVSMPASYDQPVYPSYSAPPPMPHHYDYNQQYNQQPYYQDYPMNSYADNSMIAYGNQGAAEQYYQHDQTPSPLISQLARQYVSNVHDGQYADQLLYPYGYSNSNPYVINDYF